MSRFIVLFVLVLTGCPLTASDSSKVNQETSEDKINKQGCDGGGQPPCATKNNILSRSSFQPGTEDVNLTLWAKRTAQTNSPEKPAIVLDRRDGRVFFPNGTYPISSIAKNSITSDQIVDGSLTGDEFVDESIPGTKIENNSLSSIDFIDHSIAGSAIAENTVDSFNIANDSIKKEDLAPETIQALSGAEHHTYFRTEWDSHNTKTYTIELQRGCKPGQVLIGAGCTIAEGTSAKLISSRTIYNKYPFHICKFSYWKKDQTGEPGGKFVDHYQVPQKGTLANHVRCLSFSGSVTHHAPLPYND